LPEIIMSGFPRGLARLLVAALVVLPVARATAGVFDEDARREVRDLRAEIDRKDRDIDARLQRLDESLKNLGIIQLLNQIEQLSAEIAKLRGQNEVLANDAEQLTRRQRDFYLDIDTRLRRLEGVPADPATSTPTAGSPSLASPTAGPASGAPPPVSAAAREQENRTYDVGSNLFKRGDFQAAVRAFHTFMKDFPASPLVSNAQYWIGICYSNLKDYANARSSQESLLKLYPDSPKAPDALLAIASIQIDSGDHGSARNTLEDIIARFPASDAAAKARTRLAQLKR
jgi:tol-pal system protein YbgF